MKTNSDELLRSLDLLGPQLSDFLSKSQQAENKVLSQPNSNTLSKELNLSHWLRNGLTDTSDTQTLLTTYLDNTQHLHHPHYLGHQCAVPNLGAFIADTVNGLVNNPMAIYEMGPAAATMEKVVLNWMLEKTGWLQSDSIDETRNYKTVGGGVLTHGGSMANLTAMLAARAKADPDAWTEGNSNDLVIMCPEVSHYSIARAVSMMGMGNKAIRPVKVNDLEVLQADDLSRVFAEIKAEGKKVMAVVANACATSTGLYDPLEEVGHFCQENGLWFHVDGAHGAAALVPESQRHLMRGVQMADSMIWDAHKMLRTSSLCAAALFKEHENLENAFRQKGSYLFFDKEEVGIDSLPYAIECTKSALGTKLFWALAIEGEKAMADYIDSRYEITKDFHRLISNAPDFECPYFPESNILCFRYTRYGLDDDFQLAIRNELVAQGDFYITSTTVNGTRYLRVSVMNPDTEEAHISKMLEAIVAIAGRLHKPCQE